MRLIDIDIFPLLPNKLDGDESEYERGYHDATDNLKALPLVDAVPVVRGEWTQRNCFDEDENVYVCSACDEPWTLTAGTPLENNMHYCPNCGCDMRGESNGKE